MNLEPNLPKNLRSHSSFSWAENVDKPYIVEISENLGVKVISVIKNVGPIYSHNQAKEKVNAFMANNGMSDWTWTGHWNSEGGTSYAKFEKRVPEYTSAPEYTSTPEYSLASLLESSATSAPEYAPTPVSENSPAPPFGSPASPAPEYAPAPVPVYVATPTPVRASTNAPTNVMIVTENQKNDPYIMMEKKVDNQLIIGIVVGAVLFLLLSIIFGFKKKIKLRIMGKSKGNLNSKIYSNLVSRIISGPGEVESNVENQTVTISTISTNQTVTITRPLPSVPNRNHEKDCFFFINYETYVNKHWMHIIFEYTITDEYTVHCKSAN